MSHQIFISYASEDLERIQPLVQALESKGWSVWWDRKIPLGKTFDEVIEEAIDAAKCVIVVWTKSSVKSKWVRTEAGEGEQRGILIPILLNDVKIPLAFRRIETAQLINWDGVSEHPELEILFGSVAELVSSMPASKAEDSAYRLVQPRYVDNEEEKVDLADLNGLLDLSRGKELFKGYIKSIDYHDSKQCSIGPDLLIITSQDITFPNLGAKSDFVVIKPNNIDRLSIGYFENFNSIYITTKDGRKYGFIAQDSAQKFSIYEAIKKMS